MAETKSNGRLLSEASTDRVIGAAIEVHSCLGPGLLESAYECALTHELVGRGADVRRQVEVPVEYKGIQLDAGFRIDLLVDSSVVVELKAVERILPVHEAQLLTYLKLSRLRVGLLINFNVQRLKDGILRRVL
ncbi:MAG: GxxExxY protein [Phycisphaerales bacterium]